MPRSPSSWRILRKVWTALSRLNFHLPLDASLEFFSVLSNESSGFQPNKGGFPTLGMPERNEVAIPSRVSC
jgi:hypothetical protein